MGEAVGVVNWFRSFFFLDDESDEAERVLKQERARSKAVTNDMNNAAERLKCMREAVGQKASALVTGPHQAQPSAETGDTDDDQEEVPPATQQQLKSSAG